VTTIAYHHKSKTIAVDSRYTRGDIIETDKGRKTKTNDRGLWVFAGASCDYDALMLLNHGDKVDIRPACGAILISDGDAYSVDTDNNGVCSIEILTEDLTVGSGQYFAMAAMDFGKSAKEAVKYAATRDIYTGGKVHEFKLK